MSILRDGAAIVPNARGRASPGFGNRERRARNHHNRHAYEKTFSTLEESRGLVLLDGGIKARISNTRVCILGGSQPSP